MAKTLPAEDSPLRQWRKFTTEEERRTWATGIADSITVDRNARLIVVSGVCPECGHSFEQRLSDWGIPEDAWISRSGESPRPGALDWNGALIIPAVCHCAEPHPGRAPEISHGCGAFGWLEDTPDDAPQG